MLRKQVAREQALAGHRPEGKLSFETSPDHLLTQMIGLSLRRSGRAWALRPQPTFHLPQFREDRLRSRRNLKTDRQSRRPPR
jgi:hypothetical protein